MRKGTLVLVGFGLVFLVLGAAIPGQPVCANVDEASSTVDRCARLADGTPDVRSPFVYYGLGGVLSVSGVLFELAGVTRESRTESST